jgi:hypothetical protein
MQVREHSFLTRATTRDASIRFHARLWAIVLGLLVVVYSALFVLVASVT